MTGLKGNSEFCLFVCEAEENIEVDGKQNSLFSAGPLIKCLGLVIPPNSKLGKKKLPRNRLLYAGWRTNLPRFQGTRPGHVRVESSCCRFP